MNRTSLCAELDNFSVKIADENLRSFLSGSRPADLFPVTSMKEGVSLQELEQNVSAYNSRLGRQKKRFAEVTKNLKKIQADIAKERAARKASVNCWIYTVVCMVISVIASFILFAPISGLTNGTFEWLLSYFTDVTVDVSEYYTWGVQLIVALAATFIFTMIMRKKTQHKPGAGSYVLGILVAALFAPLLPFIPVLIVFAIAIALAIGWFWVMW